MLESDIESKLRDLIVEILGARDSEIRPEASLFHDLGADGLDGEEFMEAYAKHFQVDMSDFEVSRHFGPEAGFNPFSYFYWRFFKPDVLRKIPITLAHLVDCARTRRWITPSEPARADFERSNPS